MKRTLVYLFIMLLLASTMVSADTGRKGKKGSKPFIHPALMEKMNLTDEQQDKIRELHFANEKSEIETRSQIKLLRLEMKQAMMADEIDKSEVLSLSEQVSELQAKLKNAKLSMMLEINDMLDKSQKKIWRDHMLMMGERRGERAHAPMHQAPMPGRRGR